ncbi:MAG: TolC family protein [Myxococcales bacterium]|nr:TolC family protein [Myxococcales bacterium]
MACALLLLTLGATEAPLELKALLREVSARSPRVLVQRAELDAARAKVAAAGAWEDALGSVMVEELPLRKGAEELMPMVTYRLSQPLNLFGRRKWAKEAAGASASASEASLRRAEWDARAQAVSAFYELWMSREMQSILERQLATLERMRDSAKGRYAAGLGMAHHELLRAEAELASMRAERDSLLAERPAVESMLNVLRGRPSEEAVGAPRLPPRSPLPELEAVLESSSRRPELRAMRAVLQEAKAKVQLARRMVLPMPMVSAFYEQRLGMAPDSFGGELMVTLPLWWFDRQANELAMAEAMAHRAERDVEAMAAMTQAELRMAFGRARASELALEALERFALVRIRETVASSEAEYLSGGGEFLRLLESVQALQQLEGRRLEAVARREVTRFELERLLGGLEADG